MSKRRYAFLFLGKGTGDVLIRIPDFGKVTCQGVD